MANKQMSTKEGFNEILLYTTPNGEVKLDVFVQDETIWLTQKMMSELFGVKENTITYHLKEIYESGELIEKATTRKIRVVRNEGKREVLRNIDFYNLIMANSPQLKNKKHGKK